jgi:hypothetical protein
MTAKLPKVTEIVPLELNPYYQCPNMEYLDTLNLLAGEINNERLCGGSSAIKIYIGCKGIIYNFIIENIPFSSSFGNVCYEWTIQVSFYKDIHIIDEPLTTTTLSFVFPVEVIRFFISTLSLTDLECYA